MLTILGGLAALWLLLMILGLVGLFLGIGILIGYAFKALIIFGVIYVCVRIIAKILGLI